MGHINAKMDCSAEGSALGKYGLEVRNEREESFFNTVVTYAHYGHLIQPPKRL